jgi:hypothetical protein
MTDLGTWGSDAKSQAWGINDLGDVVGVSYALIDHGHALLWPAGAPAAPTYLTGGHALDVNSSRQVVASDLYAGGSAVVWQDGVVTSLAAPAGYTSPYAKAINEAGGVGGGAVDLDASGPSASAWIVNNTFVANVAAGGAGGALLVRNFFTAHLVNNIFSQNKGPDWGNPSSTGNSAALPDDAVGSSVEARNCLAFSSVSLDADYHYQNVNLIPPCLYDDPAFCGGAERPYWLQPESPARGAGLTHSEESHVPCDDMEGRPRCEGDPDGDVDIGAYEDNPECPP